MNLYFETERSHVDTNVYDLLDYCPFRDPLETYPLENMRRKLDPRREKCPLQIN